MLPELSAIASSYAFSQRTMEGLIQDFTPEDWAMCDACGHTPRWILGHLALCRSRVVSLMGLPELPCPWSEAFLKGSSPANVPEGIPVQELLTTYRQAHEAMESQWESLCTEHMAQSCGRTLPDGTDRIADAIRFLAWHETYHLGQLGLLRRLAGKPGLA